MPDPADINRAPVCRFGPDRRLIALCGGLAAIAVAVAVLSSDPAGRLLAAGVAVVLGGYAVTDLVFWPRLVASGEGLRVHTPTARAQLAWSDIHAIRVDERNRYGLRSRTLEVDAGTVLVVLSGRALGSDPRAGPDQREAGAG